MILEWVLEVKWVFKATDSGGAIGFWDFGMGSGGITDSGGSISF
jgi:hypothetical protein